MSDETAIKSYNAKSISIWAFYKAILSVDPHRSQIEIAKMYKEEFGSSSTIETIRSAYNKTNRGVIQEKRKQSKA